MPAVISNAWYSILTTVYGAFLGKSDADIGAVSRTSAEKEKAAELKKSGKGLQSLLSKAFLVNLAITVFFTVLFVWLAVSVNNDGEVNSFDPFSILDVDPKADLKAIKKAYKKKSLIYHPDKNPNNPQAEAMFMMVAKAYEALTDEEAKANYEKFGNPDGKQSLEVSIGLPSFLLEAGNRNLVLITYLIFMVGVIPFAVWTYYSDSSKFGEKDVMYDTYSWFHHTLSEHTLVKSLPEVLAGSAEFRQANMPKTLQDKEEIATIMTDVRSQMQKPKYNHPVCVKGNVLLHAHLLRKTDKLSANAKQALKHMLRLSNSLIDAMISVCQHQDSLQTAANCIELGQYVAQGLWIKDSPLLQLPHFTLEAVKHCEKGKASTKAANIQQYRAIPDSQKKGMATFTDEQKEDVSKALSIIPDISITTKVYVDDDEDDKVYEGDLCTVLVTLTRNNLEKGEKAGLVHAPRFPFPKQEAWWFALGTKEGKIISIEKVGNPGRIVQHKIKFLAPREGTYEFDLHVKSNAYIGLDQKHKVELTTMDASVLPEYKIHPDDAELDDEPTLFEEMLNANVEQDSDSDDEDDDDSDNDEDGDDKDTDIRELTAAEKKKLVLQKARKAAAAGDDDDDSDDSDVEEVFTQN
eukprot:scaffold331953_cov57-Attheya_sp.AAC.2